MITHRSSHTHGFRRSLTATGLTAALLVGSAGAAATPAVAAPKKTASHGGKHSAPKTTAKSKKKRKAKRSEADGLVLTFTATPHAGQHAGQRIDETFVFGGKLFTLVHRTTAGDSTSLWGPLIDTGTVGVIARPPSDLALTTEYEPVAGGFCFTEPAWAPQWRADEAYARGLQRSVAQIEAWRTNAASRSGLATGPVIDGHATVTGKVGTWPTLDRTGATVALDAATGEIRQITPLGFPDFAVDIAGWSVKEADGPAVLAIADPDDFEDARAFVQGPCKG